MISEAVEEAEEPPLGARDPQFAAVPPDSWEGAPGFAAGPPGFAGGTPQTAPLERPEPPGSRLWASYAPNSALGDWSHHRMLSSGRYMHKTPPSGWSRHRVLSFGRDWHPSRTSEYGCEGSSMWGEPSDRGAGTCHHPRRKNSAEAHPRRSPMFLPIVPPQWPTPRPGGGRTGGVGLWPIWIAALDLRWAASPILSHRS